jgi:hypothetical protein
MNLDGESLQIERDKDQGEQVLTAEGQTTGYGMQQEWTNEENVVILMQVDLAFCLESTLPRMMMKFLVCPLITWWLLFNA